MDTNAIFVVILMRLTVMQSVDDDVVLRYDHLPSIGPRHSQHNSTLAHIHLLYSGLNNPTESDRGGMSSGGNPENIWQTISIERSPY